LEGCAASINDQREGWMKPFYVNLIRDYTIGNYRDFDDKSLDLFLSLGSKLSAAHFFAMWKENEDTFKFGPLPHLLKRGANVNMRELNVLPTCPNIVQ
jgi:hypothetical protein